MSSATNDKMDSETQMNVNDLPLEFKCKYLGSQNARGLWGIKHTRRPVDHLVSLAKNLTSNRQLSFCNLTVDKDGVHLEQLSSGVTAVTTKLERIHWTIDTISYGVQDLVYTRVFAMIVVKEDVQVKNDNLFEVHAFVCDSRHQARRLTYALAAAFQEYSRIIKLSEDIHAHSNNQTAKMKSRFAIDLRTPEELHQEHETEA